MTIRESLVPPAASMLQERKQLKDRMSRVNRAATLQEVLALVADTGLESDVMALAKQTMAAFFGAAITDLETRLTDAGVDLDV
jgi:hypothetical protein